MAPPANRRTGFSRRAQYSTFLAYVAGVLGLMIGGLVLLGSFANHSAFSLPRTLASDVTVPAARLVASGRSAVGGAADMLGGYFTWGNENVRLHREVAMARVRQVEASAQASENHRLKALLQLAQGDPKPVANAWLIAATGSSTRRYATISAGNLAGVKPGMPVRTPLGLVGRVLEVGQVSARVLLVIDTESVVPVRRAKDGIPAFASGRADGSLQLRLLSLGINPLKPGDAFVTSGSGGLYWPGTPIAVVTSLTHDGAMARVLSDPASSEMVMVQPAWDPTADATLPPPAGTIPPPPKAKPAKAKPASAKQASAKPAKSTP